MIVFCGYANSDVGITVRYLPGPGSRVQAIGAIERHDGGMAANAATAAARLGAAAHFAGTVGDDAASAQFLDALAAEGVDTNWVDRTGRLTTALVLRTPDGERAIVSEDDDLTADQVGTVAGRLGNSDWLYLDGYHADHAASVPDGVALVFDLDGCANAGTLHRALDRAAHALVGRTLLQHLVGDVEPAWLARTHRVHLVVTDGAAGWDLYPTDGDPVHGAAAPADVRDSTGAGDCFAGAYLASLELGLEPICAARRAGVAAALSTTAYGARTAMPTRAVLDEALARLATDSGAHPPVTAQKEIR